MRKNTCLAAALLLVSVAVVPAWQSTGIEPRMFDGMRWRPIGPMRASRTCAVAGHRGHPYTFYMGVCNGGVWKTTDAGTTWTPIFDDQPTQSIGAVVAVALWIFVGYLSLIVPLIGGLYGLAQWRAAGWRLRDGRLAVRALRIARTTVLAPARFRESHTLAQTVLQRRARLADLEVAFGKSTTARIRHLEAADARATWSAL